MCCVLVFLGARLCRLLMLAFEVCCFSVVRGLLFVVVYCLLSLCFVVAWCRLSLSLGCWFGGVCRRLRFVVVCCCLLVVAGCLFTVC